MNPKITKLQKEINSRQAKISELRNLCSHKNFTKKYGSNTGNYDPSSDIYWVDITCLDCGKNMHFYSDDENYRKY